MAYVRYRGPNGIEEDFLFFRPLLTTTTWHKNRMYFQDSGFIHQGRRVECFMCCDVRSTSTCHCSSEGSLSTSDYSSLSPPSGESCFSKIVALVMQEVIQVLNLIKSRSLNSEHVHLLYHSKVRWLSRGHVLQGVVTLREEVNIVLLEKNHPLATQFSESKWMLQVAYNADIFAEINNLNISLQDHDQTLVGLSEKLAASKDKLKLWKKTMAKQKDYFHSPEFASGG